MTDNQATRTTFVRTRPTLHGLVKCGIAECGSKVRNPKMRKGLRNGGQNAECGKDSLQGRSQKLVNLQIALSCGSCTVRWIEDRCMILR